MPSLASALSAGLGQHQSLAPPKKMPRVAWGSAGAKHSLVALGWLDRAVQGRTCWLTRRRDTETRLCLFCGLPSGPLL
jgi:hypothetical protein